MRNINEISSDIDAACDENNEKKLQGLVSEIEQCISSENSEALPLLVLYYDLGNAYSGLDKIRNRTENNIWSFNNIERINSIKAYRKCVKQSYADAEAKNIFCIQSYTNLGNIFSEAGRIIHAIDSWKKALLIRKNFGMAQGNLGIGLVEYAKSLYDDNHAALISREAYFLLKSAIKSNDVYKEAKSAFVSYKEILENHFSSNLWLEKLDFPDYFNDISESEKKYKLWELKKSLFLNPLNDVYNESFVAHDIIHLPSITTEKYEAPKYHGLFNEIKQQYVSARYMYYLYLQKHSDYDNDFSDEGNLLIDTLDYALYGYKYELLRTAYKNLYSILDKIAFFVNDYFCLGIQERNVSFNAVWYDHKKRNFINPMIEKLTNNPLRGLYYLSKDFYSYDLDYLHVADSDAQKLADLRNCLEHRYVKITQYKNNINNFELYDNFAYQITIDEFERKTEKMLHYVREAIIYLSLAVHINEKKNFPKNGKIIPITMRAL